jgi:hypothetical protein
MDEQTLFLTELRDTLAAFYQTTISPADETELRKIKGEKLIISEEEKYALMQVLDLLHDCGAILPEDQ